MVNVGIIGMGRSGWELHAAPLSRILEYNLVAVCDQSSARRASAAEAFGVRTYAEAPALIADPDVHLVVVAAPSNLHAALAIAALEEGKNVVVEKPMALNLAEADAMVAAAERAGTVLTVFHNRHWDPDYLIVKQMVRHHVLGDLLTLDSCVMTYGPEWTTFGVPEFDPGWRLKAAYGGGFLGDWGPHLVEQVLDLTGELPLSVTCQLRSQLWAVEVEDYFNIRLTFPSGLLVTLEGSNNSRLPKSRWFVVGREATLIAEGSWGRWTDMQIRGTVGELPVDVVPRGVAPSSPGHKFDVSDGLSAMFYGDLFDALQNGRPPEITARRARNVMVVLEAARESNACGCTIELDPQGNLSAPSVAIG